MLCFSRLADFSKFYRADVRKYEKFELLDHGDFWLSQTPEEPSFGWDAACKRICTWGFFKVKNTGTKFYMFNVHFDHRGPEAKLNSAKLLCEKIKEIAGTNKIIVTGDFNLTPDKEGIQIMKDILLDSREISESPPYGPIGTGNGFDLVRKLTKRIDYIFVSEGITVRKYAILSDTKDNRYPSDHLPVVAEITME
jgi:endonuclease/exonuclease/phosphatase family metal-dependent hydrolase